MDQHIRNQLSVMAWVMAALCGWVMFLSAHAISAEHARQKIADHYSNTISAPHK
jgi:hypothetical protein